MHGGIHNELPDDAAQEKKKVLAPLRLSLVAFETNDRVNSQTATKEKASGSDCRVKKRNFRPASETFVRGDSSIRVQPITGLFLARFRKTPRWQPRGHDTQSFRPLVQEEEVSSRARVLVRRLRVNSLWPVAACCAADSILFERKLTRM